MTKDWTKLVKKYGGMWVALATDEETVLAADVTARKALTKAVKDGHAHPIMARIPEDLRVFVGVL